MDQRASQRIKVSATVTCHIGSGDRQDRLRDMSVGGCRIGDGGGTLTEGMRLDMTLLAGVRVSGTVRWAEGGQVGVQFDEEIGPATLRYFTLDLEGDCQSDPTFDSFGRALPPLKPLLRV